MGKEELNKLRKRLDDSIERGDDYSVIYDLSLQLDELITKYNEKVLLNG